jgi:hypothetical protein
MEIQADIRRIRRRLGADDTSIDLPVAGATRCGFTHLQSSPLYRLPHSRRQGSC